MPRKYRAKATQISHYEIDVIVPDHVGVFSVEEWVELRVRLLLKNGRESQNVESIVIRREDPEVYDFVEVRDAPKV